MSIKAVNWAIDQKTGGPSAKCVLWSIANYANDVWCSWPSQKTIGEESEQSADSVQKRIPELEAVGLVRRIPLHFQGRRSVDFYILAPSKYFKASLPEIEPLLPRGFVPSPKYAALDSGCDKNVATANRPSAGNDSAFESTSVLPSDAAADSGCDKNVATAHAAALQRQQEPMNQGGSGRDACAREVVCSPQAHRLSGDIAKLCGHDMAFLPPRWARDGARIAQAWIDAGYSVEMMLGEVQLVMARKRDGKPETPSYFDKPFAREHAMRSQPHEVPKVTIIPRAQETIQHVNEPERTADDWKSSRDNWRRAAAKLRAATNGPGRARGSGS